MKMYEGGILGPDGRPMGGRPMKICCICDLPVRPGQKTTPMADGSKTHEVCFDIVCAGIAADAGLDPEAAQVSLRDLHHPEPQA
jgi:hypothetical protein